MLLPAPTRTTFWLPGVLWLCAGFVHYTEVLEGPDGAKALGWPGFHRSNVHASPLLYDIDMDGIRDVMVVTYDGEVVFFKDNVSTAC